MKKRIVKILAFVMVLMLMLTGAAYAAQRAGDGVKAIPRPKMTVVGSTATCSVRLTAPGKLIDATLELKQGSTVIASWSDADTGELTLSGTATVTSGVTYTLTVYGTIDSVPFTPVSITKTP